MPEVPRIEMPPTMPSRGLNVLRAIAYSPLGTSASSPRAAVPELDPLHELLRLVSEDSGRGQYRVQFLGPQSR